MRLLGEGGDTQDLAAEQTFLTHTLAVTPNRVRLFAEMRGVALTGGGYTVRGYADGEPIFESDVLKPAGTNRFDVEMLAHGEDVITITLQNLSGVAESKAVTAWLSTDDAILDQLPYALDACVVVEAGATDVARGTNLAAAYVKACALTPGGKALSHENRACVLMPPGGMDVAAVTLVLDTEFVDLIATDPQRGFLPATDYLPPPTVVYSTEDDTTVVEQAVQDVRLIGFAIAQLSADVTGAYHAFHCSADDNEGSIYDRMYFWLNAATSECSPVSFAKHIMGTWRDCISRRFAWCTVAGGEFSPQMFDCYAGSDSFMGDTGLGSVACLMERCKAGIQSFGGCVGFGLPIDAGSVFIDCEAGRNSFGVGKLVEGTFIRCRGGDYCFGSTTLGAHTGNFAGYAEDCVAGKASFGGCKTGIGTHGKCTGTLIRCISRESELVTRLEGATLEGCLLTTGTVDIDGVTLLDSGSRIYDSTILVVEGGTGIPINAATAQSISAAGNRYNNRSASETGLGENVTNTGAGEPAAILTDTDALDSRLTDERAAHLDADISSRAVPDDLNVSVLPMIGDRVPTRLGITFSVFEDSTEIIAWHLVDSNEDDIDLTDATLSFEVYKKDGTLSFQKTSPDGGIIIAEALEGQINITIDDGDVDTAGDYNYELWMVKAGEKTCLFQDDFQVLSVKGPQS